ncbi:MAG: hypothetical protein ACOVLD_00545 [Bacteroidia bacterium]
MNIAINKPCHEDWNKMTPNDKGAFCAICTKDVIDFSKKTVQEIKDFFAKPINGKVCGRFKEEQLEEISFESFIEHFVGFKLTKKVIVIVALTFATWFMGVAELNAQNKIRMGKVAPVKTNAVKPINVKGDVKVTPKDTTKCTKPNSETIKMGEVVAPQKKEKKVNEKKPKVTKVEKLKKEEEIMLLGDVMIDGKVNKQ